MCFRYSFWYLRLTQSWSGIIHLADRVKTVLLWFQCKILIRAHIPLVLNRNSEKLQLITI